MQIIAMLSFYDEPPELLERAVTSVLGAGADGVLALDGPYALYPHGGRVQSDRSCYQAVAATCAGRGAWCVVHRAEEPFEDNEVGKRQLLMSLALSLSGPRDWGLVVDADHRWDEVGPLDLHELEDVDQDFARVSFSEVSLGDEHYWEPMRPLMRLRRDLRMGTNHYTYVTDDGVSLILERPALGEVLPAYDLTDRVRVYHDVHDRDPAKREAQITYYEQRDGRGVES